VYNENKVYKTKENGRILVIDENETVPIPKTLQNMTIQMKSIKADMKRLQSLAYNF
jgi:hypothetical protein